MSAPLRDARPSSLSGDEEEECSGQSSRPSTSSNYSSKTRIPRPRSPPPSNAVYESPPVSPCTPSHPSFYSSGTAKERDISAAGSSTTFSIHSSTSTTASRRPSMLTPPATPRSPGFGPGVSVPNYSRPTEARSSSPPSTSSSSASFTSTSSASSSTSTITMTHPAPLSAAAAARARASGAGPRKRPEALSTLKLKSASGLAGHANAAALQKYTAYGADGSPRAPTFFGSVAWSGAGAAPSEGSQEYNWQPWPAADVRRESELSNTAAASSSSSSSGLSSAATMVTAAAAGNESGNRGSASSVASAGTGFGSNSGWGSVVSASSSSDNASSRGSSSASAGPGTNGSGNGNGPLKVLDLFGKDVFSAALKNQSLAKRLYRHAQRSGKGEGMEFLLQVEQYNTALNALTSHLSVISTRFTSLAAGSASSSSNSGTSCPLHTSHGRSSKCAAALSAASNSPTSLLPATTSKALNTDLTHITASVLPGLEALFMDPVRAVQARAHADVWPAFVRDSLVSHTAVALAQGRAAYEPDDGPALFPGLGTAFCLADPAQEDCPVRWASDGWLHASGVVRAIGGGGAAGGDGCAAALGVARREAVGKNARWLQGALTDAGAVRKIRDAVAGGGEGSQTAGGSSQLVLNYRKGTGPGREFWNLLFVAPLRDRAGRVRWFLGGMVDVSDMFTGTVGAGTGPGTAEAELLRLLDSGGSARDTFPELPSVAVGDDGTSWASQSTASLPMLGHTWSDPSGGPILNMPPVKLEKEKHRPSRLFIPKRTGDAGATAENTSAGGPTSEPSGGFFKHFKKSKALYPMDTQHLTGSALSLVLPCPVSPTPPGMMAGGGNSYYGASVEALPLTGGASGSSETTPRLNPADSTATLVGDGRRGTVQDGAGSVMRPPTSTYDRFLVIQMGDAGTSSNSANGSVSLDPRPPARPSSSPFEGANNSAAAPARPTTSHNNGYNAASNATAAAGPRMLIAFASPGALNFLSAGRAGGGGTEGGNAANSSTGDAPTDEEDASALLGLYLYRDVFAVLSERCAMSVGGGPHTLPPQSITKTFKATVREKVREGTGVSVEIMVPSAAGVNINASATSNNQHQRSNSQRSLHHARPLQQNPPNSPMWPSKEAASRVRRSSSASDGDVPPVPPIPAEKGERKWSSGWLGGGSGSANQQSTAAAKDKDKDKERETPAAPGNMVVSATGMGAGAQRLERLMTHWAPLEDADGKVAWCVVILSPARG